MVIFYHLYVLILILAVFGLWWEAWYALHQPDSTLIRWFAALCMLAIFTTMMFILLIINVGDAFTWARLRFIGLSSLPVVFLLCVLAYTGHEAWLTWRQVVPLFVIPLMTQLVIWLTPWWFYRSWQIQAVAGFNIEQVQYTGWFGVHNIYTYVLIGIALVIILRTIRRSSPFYRRQFVLIVVATGISIVTSLPAALGILPPGVPTFTPLSIITGTLLVGWALFRYRLLEIVPAAHEAIVRNLADAVLVVDNRHRLININPAAGRWLQHDERQIIGQPISQVFPQAETLLNCCPDEPESETELLLADGRVCEARVSGLYNRQRRMIGRLIMLRDITARKQAEREREQLIQDLEAYSRMVAHDLKNPLTVIMTYSSFLLMDKTLQDLNYPALIERLRHIHESAQIMNDIINSLLLLAALHSETRIPEEVLEMSRIVSRIVEQFQSHIEESRAEIYLPDTPLPNAAGYTPWIELVWMNYLSNALKYGGNPPCIAIKAEQQQGMISYQVSDNGKGLTPEQQAKVFEPFTRFHPGVEGHGLGLTTVKRIMQKLGGEAGVSSEPGKGSPFYFRLPAG